MGDEQARHPEYPEAKTAAIRLLAHQARTRGYLEQRLRGKGLAAAAVEQAVGDLARAGYVDDEQYARRRIEALLGQSKQGPQALTHRLVQDGVDQDLAERIVTEALEGEDLSEWAAQVARERAATMRGVEPGAARRRLYGYLKRRGFTNAHCISAMESAIPDADTD